MVNFDSRFGLLSHENRFKGIGEYKKQPGFLVHSYDFTDKRPGPNKRICPGGNRAINESQVSTFSKRESVG